MGATADTPDEICVLAFLEPATAKEPGGWYFVMRSQPQAAGTSRASCKDKT